MTLSEFKRTIDTKHSAEKSIVLRYRNFGVIKLDDALLKSVSQNEGGKIFHLTNHGGVDVYVMDETTYSTTNTFEALIAMVTVAYSKKAGHDTAIFSSGGNLGTALAAYCKQAGIRAFSFNPLQNVPLLDARWFTGDIHLIGVEDAQKTRDTMLVVRKKMRDLLGYDPLIPTIPWRLKAAQFRGFPIIEFAHANKLEFSAIAQTISAGFGPIGTYKTLAWGKRNGLLKKLPAFLGVQQESNCYMYNQWKGKKIPHTSDLIVPTLFDKNPHKTFGTYPDVAGLLRRTKGDIVTVNKSEFVRYITPQIHREMRRNNLAHTMKGGEPVGRSGLMSLAGVFKAIDAGIIKTGPVLVCMTDGAQKLAKPAAPEIVIRSKADINSVLSLLK